jgi:hypothetical protein
VIEITVTKPYGTATIGNMRVQQSDLEMLQELKNMRRREIFMNWYLISFFKVNRKIQ